MYLILNKENDYKKNRSKITALELSYKGIVKLISNQNGNLTENMLLDIKNKQDLTYSSLETTRPLLKSVLENMSIPVYLNELVEYVPLNPNDLRPHELGFENYVDNELLTNIMKNEVYFSNIKKIFYDRITQAQNNVYNSRSQARSKAQQYGVYIPIVYNMVEPKTLTIIILSGMSYTEKIELEKLFYNLKFLFGTDTSNPNISGVLSTGTINVTDPRISVYVKSTEDMPSDVFKDVIYCKHLATGFEYKIGEFTRGVFTSETGKTYPEGYIINDSVIEQWNGSNTTNTSTVWRRVMKATPTNITNAYIQANF